MAMLVRNGRHVGVSTVRRIINGVWSPVRSAPSVPVGRVVLQRAVARGRVKPKRPPSFAEARYRGVGDAVEVRLQGPQARGTRATRFSAH